MAHLPELGGGGGESGRLEDDAEARVRARSRVVGFGEIGEELLWVSKGLLELARVAHLPKQ